MDVSDIEQAHLLDDAVQFFGTSIKAQIKWWQEKDGYDAQLHLEAARHLFSELRVFAAFHGLDVRKILARDTKLALACSVAALNPGG